MALVLSCSTLGGAAAAQQSVVDHCRQTSSDADRIACLEAALLARGEPAAQRLQADGPDPAGTTAATAVAATPVATLPALVDSPSPQLDSAPSEATLDHENAANAAPAAAATAVDQSATASHAGEATSTNTTAAPAAAEPQGIGAEQVRARGETHAESEQRLEKATGLAVARYDIVPYKKLVVTLENGQVWRQLNGDRQTFRVDLRRNQTVDIEESALGGYKLHLNEMRRTLRVERVE